MKVCFTSETVAKMRNRLPRRKKERNHISKGKYLKPNSNSTPKAVSDISNFPKSMKRVNFKNSPNL